jgi:hypothetical protein
VTSAASDRERRSSSYHPAYADHMRDEQAAELDARVGALRAGFWLGWLSIAAVSAAIALGLRTRHETALIALTAAAAAANTAVTLVPWRRWLSAPKGRVLLDLWSGGLLVFTAALVITGGARDRLDLLLFLIIPFLATVHRSWRRVAWLTIAVGAFFAMMATAPDRLPASEVVMRFVLLTAATLLSPRWHGWSDAKRPPAPRQASGPLSSTHCSPSRTTASRTASRRSPTS